MDLHENKHRSSEERIREGRGFQFSICMHTLHGTILYCKALGLLHKCNCIANEPQRDFGLTVMLLTKLIGILKSPVKQSD